MNDRLVQESTAKRLKKNTDDISCRACKTTTSRVWYHCSFCPAFDLCKECIAKVDEGSIHPPDHIFYRIPSFVHDTFNAPCFDLRFNERHNVSCNICGFQNIIGFRYICTQCGINICSVCDRRGIHPRDHNVLRLLPQHQSHTGTTRWVPPTTQNSLNSSESIDLKNHSCSQTVINSPDEKSKGVLPSLNSITKERSELRSVTRQDVTSSVNIFGDNISSIMRGFGINSSYFLSPFSLSMSLLLLSSQGKLNSQAQIAQAMNLSNFDIEKVHIRVRGIIQDALNSKQALISNAFWTSKFPFTLNFKSMCADKFFAAAYSCSHAETVNSWSRATSQNLIGKVLDGQNAPPLLSLVSTASLSAYWLHPFEPKRTHKYPFHRTHMMVTSCDMMEQEGEFRYFQTDTYEVIQLPYITESQAGCPDMELSAVIILPKKSFNLSVSALPPWYKVFERILSTVPAYGRVSIPKFACETRYPNLIPELNSLGIQDVFESESEASEIVQVMSPSSTKGNRVESVIHAVHVSATEEGTKRVNGTVRPEEQQPKTSQSINKHKSLNFCIICDKPFQFNVCDGTGMRLFMGEVRNPKLNNTSTQARGGSRRPDREESDIDSKRIRVGSDDPEIESKQDSINFSAPIPNQQAHNNCSVPTSYTSFNGDGLPSMGSPLVPHLPPPPGLAPSSSSIVSLLSGSYVSSNTSQMTIPSLSEATVFHQLPRFNGEGKLVIDAAGSNGFTSQVTTSVSSPISTCQGHDKPSSVRQEREPMTGDANCDVPAALLLLQNSSRGSL